MRDNVTLGEVKRCCKEMTEKYGDDCCNRCRFSELGCCDAPDRWVIEPGICESQPNWEEMFKKSEETCREMYMKMEDAHRRADRADEEIRRLRLIVSTVETMLGRKFDEDYRY